MPDLEIVLATFNGERFLPALLASIESQTLPVGRILVGDDDSQDNTHYVIEKAKQRGMPIEILESEHQRLGALNNFGRVLKKSCGRYILLADQDDVWSPIKIERLLHMLKETEREVGVTTPVLIYSDARLIDGNDSLLAQSAARYQGFNLRSGLLFRRMLLQNVIPGCTMMFNRALLEAATPIPDEAVMHDWWLLLTATALGRVVSTEEPLTDYRQHGGNALGATNKNLFYMVARLSVGLRQNRSKVKDGFGSAMHQAEIFHKRFSTSMRPDRLEELEAFLALAKMGPLARRIHAVRWKFFKDGFLRNLAFYFSI